MSDIVTYQIEVNYEDGSYWAEVKDLPGCFASGDSPEELNAALAEAIGIYLSKPGMTVTVSNLEPEDSTKVVEQRFLVNA